MYRNAFEFYMLTLYVGILNLHNSLMINLIHPELSVHATILFINNGNLVSSILMYM